MFQRRTRSPARSVMEAMALIAAALAVLSLASPAWAAPDSPGPASCHEFALSVDLGAAGADVPVHGTLCRPSNPVGDSVQVLLPGATYDRAYWQLRPAAGLPSYVEAMSASGLTTLALDRPGTGLSGHPDADALGLDANVAALHQIIGRLHDGTTGTRYSQVISVGHSWGSSIAVAEAQQYADVSGVIATEFLHGIGPRIDDFGASLYPAADDPVLAPENPPAGYLTTSPGARSDLFYDPADSDPATRNADELTKSTMTTGESADIATVQQDFAITRGITVPVMIADGQHDALLCGTMIDCSTAETLRAYEADYYSPRADLSAYVLAGAGHSINLHRNAPDFFHAASTWTHRIITTKRS